MTAVREDIPVIAVVINNHEWGAEKKNQIDFYDNRFVGTNLRANPDFAEVAEAMGAKGYRVEDYRHVQDVVRDAIASGRPCVINGGRGGRREGARGALPPGRAGDAHPSSAEVRTPEPGPAAHPVIRRDHMSDTQALLADYDVQDVIEKDRKHLWHHLFQHSVLETRDPQVFVEGEGARVRDIHGKEYLDGASGGVWCVNVGHGRESIARVVYEQLMRLPYYAGVVGTVPAAQYASALAEWLPELDHVYFANSGSEANEKAIKMVRQIAHLNGTGKYKVLYRDRDYHGTTIGCLAASGQEERKEAYGPFPRRVRRDSARDVLPLSLRQDLSGLQHRVRARPGGRHRGGGARHGGRGHSRTHHGGAGASFRRWTNTTRSCARYATNTV